MRSRAFAHPARHAFLKQLEQSPCDVCALAACIAWEDQDSDQRAEVTAIIASYAQMVQSRLMPHMALTDAIDVLNAFFFDELGYHGAENDYYAVAHNYVDVVLRERTGMPIVLAVVYMTVAQRCGLDCEGVAFPAHYMVQFRQPGAPPIVVDPFRGGRRWSLSECAAYLISQGTKGDVQSWLLPPTPTYTIMRMLRNLKSSHIRMQDFPRAAAALERMLLIDGRALDEMRDYGLILSKIGYANQALAYLEMYVRLNPHAADLATIKYHAASLLEHAITHN